MWLSDKINEWFYPELKRFPPGEVRKRALDKAMRLSRSDWRIYVMILGALAALVGLGSAGPRVSRWLFSHGVAEPVAALTPCFMIPLVLVLQFAVLLRFSRQRSGPLLRRMLTELGKPICTRCGYDLAGNTSGICPECGTPEGPQVEDRPPDEPAA